MSTPRPLRSTLTIACIVSAAIALNLAVMGIGRSDAGPEPVAAAAPDGAMVPEVVQVEVDIPVPAETTTTTVDLLGSTNPNAAAARLPAAPTTPPAAAPTATPTATWAATTPAPVPASPTAPTPAPAPTPAAPPASVPAPTVAPTLATTTLAPVTTTTVAPPRTEYLTYSFDGVAEIVIAHHDAERLQFWSVTTEPGWSYRVEKDSPDKVEIKFRRVSGGEGEARFEVTREDGELEVKKER